MDGGAWRATVSGATQIQTRLSDEEAEETAEEQGHLEPTRKLHSVRMTQGVLADSFLTLWNCPR